MKGSIAGATLFAALAAAHGGVTSYSMNGQTYAGWQPYNSASGQSTIERPYSSYNPLMKADLSSVNIRCNNGGSLGSGPIGKVAAGTALTAYWLQWTHAPGPVMVYMAKCPASGCNSWDGSGKVWFKIDEAGLLSGTQNAGQWGCGVVLDTLKWTSTIPASLAPGDYLIRHELLALHQANTPQFYPECAQVTVTGSGTGVPSGDFLVSFPGAYSASDPSIDFNLYSASAMTATTYKVPGPAVWPGGSAPPPPPPPASSAAPPPPPASSSRPATPTTTTVRPSSTLVTSARPTSSAPAPGGCTVAKYGQCGGQGWTGCTVCASGSTCKASGQYYSQCL